MDKPVQEMTLPELLEELDRTRPDFEDEASALAEDELAQEAERALPARYRRFLAVEAELVRRQGA